MEGGNKITTFWKIKMNAKTSCCKDICILIQQNVCIYPIFMVILYELEDKMYCISKLQIDRDFWPVLYLRHEIQDYKT